MNNLKKARLSAGFTQKQVAEAVGIAEASYQRIEYGKHLPSLKTAFKIADTLKSTVDEIFRERK